ncbi:MAG TPA: hypothetical protein VF844_10160 [Ktedonobacteraceae bacterium]
MRASTNFRRLSPLLHFILSGSVLELLYLLVVALSLFSTPHLILSPTGTDWPGTLAPAQQLFQRTLSLSGGHANLSYYYYLLLGLIVIALASVYLVTIGKAIHASDNMCITSRWLLLPLIGATLFGITLLFLPAIFSNEVYSYFFKGLALLSHLINCMLIWAILGKLAPSHRLGGTLLYAWNPLALIELVGNGHIEGLLICFLLLATWLYVQQKGRWLDFGAVILLALAISVNVIGLLLAPLFTWFSVRSKHRIVHAIWGLCWRALVALTVVFILYLPFWHGSSTFLAINLSIDMQHFVHSPLGVLVMPVRWLYSMLVQGLNLPTTISSYYLQPIAAADMTVLASAMFIFALIYFYLLGRARSIDTLLTSLCLAILGYVVLISEQFWPWYVLWALWIVALRRFDTLTVSVLLLSCTALLTYPLLYIDNVLIAIYQPLLIFGIPLVYLIANLKKSNERKTLTYDRRSETAKN